MKSIKKRRWTVESAMAYIIRVEEGGAPYGLKYCSAVDYLNGSDVYKTILAQHTKAATVE